MTSILHIVVARKPIEGTIAENCLKHGTGAINIDGCRIEPEQGDWKGKGGGGVHEHWHGKDIKNDIYGDGYVRNGVDHACGRWPANLILDTSPEVQENFPHTTSGAMKHEVDAYDGESLTTFIRGRSGPSNQHADSGSASRFFFNFTEQESTE